MRSRSGGQQGRVIADEGRFLLAATQGALFRCTGVYKSERERARLEEREREWVRQRGYMGDYKDWTFKQRDHQRCSAEIPLITDTVFLLAVTPPLPSTPTSHHHAPHPEPSKLCKQPLLHANKGTKNASGASKRQGFPNPFLHFSVLKELPFLSFHPFFSLLFMHSLICTCWL